jgi:RNA polymerase sigma factor (sigma-70 family)
MGTRRIPEQQYRIGGIGLTEEQKQLVEQNIPLAVMCAKKLYKIYNSLKPDYEELLSEAKLGLCKAAVDFDPEKGFRFSTYAVWIIEGRIRLYLRDKLNLIRRPRKGVQGYEASIRYTYIPLDALINDEDNSNTLHEIIGRECEEYGQIELWESIRKHTNQREQQILIAHFYEGKSQRDIGKMIGVSQVQVSRIMTAAYKRLRLHLAA